MKVNEVLLEDRGKPWSLKIEASILGYFERDAHAKEEFKKKMKEAELAITDLVKKIHASFGNWKITSGNYIYRDEYSPISGTMIIEKHCTLFPHKRDERFKQICKTIAELLLEWAKKHQDKIAKETWSHDKKYYAGELLGSYLFIDIKDENYDYIYNKKQDDAPYEARIEYENDRKVVDIVLFGAQRKEYITVK